MAGQGPGRQGQDRRAAVQGPGRDGRQGPEGHDHEPRDAQADPGEHPRRRAGGDGGPRGAADGQAAGDCGSSTSRRTRGSWRSWTSEGLPCGQAVAGGFAPPDPRGIFEHRRWGSGFGRGRLGPTSEARCDHELLGTVARLAGGLTFATLSKLRFSSACISVSAPPASTLATKVPPGSSTSKASWAAASTRATMRMWSVPLWPEDDAAMSDITTSAGPPSQSLTLSSAPSARKSSWWISAPGDRLHLLQVEAEDAADLLARLLAKRVHARHRDLAPAARRAAQIDHARAGQQEAVLVVQLQDLVGRAAAIALALGAGDIGVVKLPLQPQRRGQLAALGGLDPHPQIARAAAAGLASRLPGCFVIMPLRSGPSGASTPSALICA